MAAYPQIKIRHSPVTTYPGTAQGNWVGAQDVAGRRGMLPTFNDSNAYFISKAGKDSNAGAAAAPKLTLGSLFQAAASTADYSGNGYNLTATGSPVIQTTPLYPLPPAGMSHIAGGFSSSNYYSGPSGLKTAMSSLSAFTLEGWFYIPGTQTPQQVVYMNTGNGVTSVFVSGSSGAQKLNFQVSGTTISSAAGTIVNNRWYYFAGVFTSAATNGQKLWLGTSPQDAAVVAQGTLTSTTGTVSDIRIGDFSTSSAIPTDFVGRVAFSTVARTSFPTPGGSTNLAGLYTFNTPPLMQSAPKSYIVIQDSGTYREALYSPWAYDLLTPFSIYAADGKTPVFDLTRGASAGEYGPNNSTRTAPSSANYYINQTAGNDGTGTRNDPSKPFKTINAALADGSVTNNDVFLITDSGIYTENLTMPATPTGLTVASAAGQIPVLRPAALAATAGHIALGNTGAGATFDNLIFDGRRTGGGLVSGSAGGSATFSNCAVRYYATGALGGMTMTTTASLWSGVPAIADATSLLSATGSFFGGNVAGSSLEAVSLGGAQSNLTTCTFTNYAITAATSTKSNLWNRCLFQNCTMVVNHTAAVVATYTFSACYLDKANLVVKAPNTANTQLVYCNFINCFQRANGASFAAGFQLLPVGGSFGGTLVASLSSCAAIGNTANFLISDRATANLTNITSVNGGTYGVRFGAYTQGITDNLVSTGDANGWSADGTSSATLGTYYEYNASLISTATGSENITLSANDPGILGSQGGLLDLGVDQAAWDIVCPITLNGLTFSGVINTDAALKSSLNTPVVAQFCSFLGLGTYGASGGDGSSFTDCYFATNGHAVKISKTATTVQRCVGLGCGGAFILNRGEYATVDHDTAWACQYGLYDGYGTISTALTNNIFSGSGAYDYSGDSVFSYSCIGTLDPDRAGSVDQYSTRFDPLFRAPVAGDLRIQAIAAGSYFDSPCLGTGAAGADMGAYTFAYGTATTSWTLLDFGAQDILGNFYRNPDRVVRREMPIKLAEADQENGGIFSVYATVKREYEFTWESNTNDMPRQQTEDMRQMFMSFTNKLEIDFGFGQGWVPAYFARQAGFEYTDMTGFYSSAEQPIPVRSMVVREA